MNIDPDRWQRIQEILDTSADVSSREDISLLREVEQLGFDDNARELIEESLWSIDPEDEDPQADDSRHRRSIGPYRIERLLGRGGMGAVYLAVRQDDFEQQVALKLINPGMHTGEILDRFLNERQILAHLQHPNIARLLDGGTTEDGLPYFVMEYVEGESIDAYCQARKLSVDARLALFRQVCSAVHVAHQNLVVHRDIKPSNILITPDGVPKLLDFGIAKILSPDLASRGLETVTGRHPMTPNYASPEQVLDEIVTTVSDVYSLGVLLYQLLSGHAPYRVDGAPYQEMVHVVCKAEPTRPSSTVASKTQTTTKENSSAGKPAAGKEAHRLRRRLSGDLDAIVLKAMRKEPGHRYRSAEQLSDDILRHLEGETVLARQGTWTYLTSKYIRRHKLGLAVMLLVFGFAVSTTVLWLQASEEREQARLERSRSQRVVEFFEGLFLASNPNEARGREVTAREILDRGREDIAEGLQEDLETQAYLLRSLGVVYNNLGVYDTAREVREKALELRRKINSADDPELATEIANLAKLEYDIGNHEVAERYYREALRIRQIRGQNPIDIARTLNNLANTLSVQGKYAEAEEAQSRVLEMRVRALGESDLDVGWTRYGLGVTNYANGNLDMAESLLRRALDTYVEQVGTEHTRVASIRGFLGLVLHELRRYEEAEHALRGSLETRRILLGEAHRDVAVAKVRLASLLLSRGEVAIAGELLGQALPLLQESLAANSSTLVEAEGIFGSYLVASGRYEKAEAYLRRGYTLTRAAKGNDTTYTRIALRRLRDLDEAMSQAEEGTDSNTKNR